MFNWFKKKEPKKVKDKIILGEVVTETGRVYMTVFQPLNTNSVGFTFSNASQYDIVFDKKALPQLRKILSKVKCL